MSRLGDLVRFYDLLSRLDQRLGGCRRLATCDGRSGWPTHGVYFFFEPGEQRSDSGSGLRVVRVGTHALTATSRTTLWDRLSTHRGIARSGGGNHRGSIFRLLVGEALLRRDGRQVESWGVAQSPGAAAQRVGISREALREAERPVEGEVSAAIGAMPFLWVAIEPADRNARALIEAGALSLLSNLDRETLDAASQGWLGRQSGRALVRGSGLWNNEHVERSPDPAFLDVLKREIERSKW